MYEKRNKLVAFWLNDRFTTPFGKMSLAEVVGTLAVPAALTEIVVLLATR